MISALKSTEVNQGNDQNETSEVSASETNPTNVKIDVPGDGKKAATVGFGHRKLQDDSEVFKFNSW